MKQTTMQVEVSAAINLIAASLYNNLPRRRVDEFAEEIEKGIVAKFLGHWYPDNPSKGAAFRCINVSGQNVDPLILYAAFNSNLTMKEVTEYLPKDLTIWIDPGEVSFCVGEKGQVRVLYSERRPTTTGTVVIPTAEDTVQTSPPQLPLSFASCSTAVTSIPPVSSPLASPDEMTSNLSSSLGSLSLSSGGSGTNGTATSWGTTPSPIPWRTTSINNPWSPMSPQKPSSFSAWNAEPTFNTINVQPAFQVGTLAAAAVPVRPTNSNKTMTAAMFAQTKFGSTKLKNHTKRSNRLSPTEGFNRSVQGSNMYPTGSIRHNPTMSSAFLDRMQTHMNNTTQNDFAIDHFKTNTNSMRANPVERLTMMANGNPIGSSYGAAVGRFSPSTMNSSTGGMFSGDQDWIDLSDLNLSSGNPLLAA